MLHRNRKVIRPFPIYYLQFTIYFLFNRRRPILRLIFLILFIQHSAFSILHSAEGCRDTFFDQGPGVKATAMAEAFTASGDDASVAYYNPALLSTLNHAQLALSYWLMYDGAHYDYVGFATKFGDHSAFALSGTQFTRDNLEARRTIADTPIGFANNQMALYASYSTRVLGCNIGVSAKYVRHALYTYQSASWGCDVGVQKYLLYHDDNEQTSYISVGACAQNVVQPSLKLDTTYETFPTTYRAGLAWHTTFAHHYNFVEGRARFHTLTLEADAVRDEFSTRGIAGLELGIANLVALRVGYNDHLTAGCGLTLVQWMQLDYAYSVNDLDVYHRVGLVVRFGSEKSYERNVGRSTEVSSEENNFSMR